MAAEFKHTILCVDDERDNVEALERIFRKKYRVLKATSGQEALKIMKDNSVSLIISDQRMPEMTGVEMLSKSLDIHPNAVRILLTGYTDIESVIAAINSGEIYRYVTKPWDPRDLEIAVDRAIERFEMAGELRKKNAELEKAYKDLKSLDETKSQFMILINHELKTPLTTLISYLDLLKETKLDEEQTLFVKRLLSSVSRLKEIVFDVLEFVSAETGQTKIKAKKTKLQPLIDQAQERLSDEIKKKKQKLKLDMDAEELVFDPKLLQSVLDKILHNAVKFGDEGSTIRVGTMPAKENKALVFVENTGKPLPPETIQKILQPFALDENIMNHSKGIGMGLSISQALLKLHGSQLRFDSSGNTVRVEFALDA